MRCINKYPLLYIYLTDICMDRGCFFASEGRAVIVGAVFTWVDCGQQKYRKIRLVSSGGRQESSCCRRCRARRSLIAQVEKNISAWRVVRFEGKKRDSIRSGKRVFIEDFRRRITCPYYQIPSERKGI